MKKHTMVGLIVLLVAGMSSSVLAVKHSGKRGVIQKATRNTANIVINSMRNGVFELDS